MQPCIHVCCFFGGGTKAKTACDALLKLSKFPLFYKHSLFLDFLLLIPHYFIISVFVSFCWHRRDLISQVPFWTSFWNLCCPLFHLWHCFFTCEDKSSIELLKWRLIKKTANLLCTRFIFSFCWLQLRCNTNSSTSLRASRTFRKYNVMHFLLHDGMNYWIELKGNQFVFYISGWFIITSSPFKISSCTSNPFFCKSNALLSGGCDV